MVRGQRKPISFPVPGLPRAPFDSGQLPSIEGGYPGLPGRLRWEGCYVSPGALSADKTAALSDHIQVCSNTL